MILGAHRAKSGADYLTTLGVPAGDISTVSYGEELPIDPAHNEAAWAKNRRDHFKVD
jgi:peptidoglycan-associated lipoprotein